ncbi:GatB/YqeY domain-containing protein [Patescibacteria group bacterium]|nr:GatB/YqeY domain-containing protein [Patescibacteria group bacterium]
MLFDKLQSDLKEAQLKRDEVRVSTLRLLLSELQNRKIDLRQNSKQADLSDTDVVKIIQQEIKKRKEAATGFRSGGKEDLVAKEELEAKILACYLPEQMSEEELTKVISDIIKEACQPPLASELEKPSLQDMGKVIRLVMEKVKGRADGKTVSTLVKEQLLK